mmetsp:Transcript_14910/g.47522  ORF Transcript_14910/g.47522 Transcript_14910/m.47522 type:complete len:252 (-) Transcript_14910:235-990(-)
MKEPHAEEPKRQRPVALLEPQLGIFQDCSFSHVDGSHTCCVPLESRVTSCPDGRYIIHSTVPPPLATAVAPSTSGTKAVGPSSGTWRLRFPPATSTAATSGRSHLRSRPPLEAERKEAPSGHHASAVQPGDSYTWRHLSSAISHSRRVPSRESEMTCPGRAAQDARSMISFSWPLSSAVTRVSTTLMMEMHLSLPATARRASPWGCGVTPSADTHAHALSSPPSVYSVASLVYCTTTPMWSPKWASSYTVA